MPVILKGQTQLIRAFNAASKDAAKELRAELRGVAEPVRVDAEKLAVATIPRIGKRWWKMRSGVTTKLVYVAPVQRGIKGRGDLPGRRPRFADLLMGRAMEPALERNEARAGEAAQNAIDHVIRDWEAL